MTVEPALLSRTYQNRPGEPDDSVRYHAERELGRALFRRLLGAGKVVVDFRHDLRASDYPSQSTNHLYSATFTEVTTERFVFRVVDEPVFARPPQIKFSPAPKPSFFQKARRFLAAEWAATAGIGDV